MVWPSIVEALIDKIGPFQRRAYGLRDAECLRFEVLTSVLAAIESSCHFHPYHPEENHHFFKA